MAPTIGQVACFCVAVCALIYFAERLIFSVPYPANIPLIRERPGVRRFSLRTRLAYYTDCRRLYQEAWDEYLNHGKPVVIPGMGFRKEVILPPAQLKWVLSQPDALLNTPQAMAEVDQAKWSLGHEGPVTDSWQGMLVKTEMNRVLESICAALNDELGRAFDKHFGTDKTWRELDLRQSIFRAIAQANGRFTVGLPLCRDEEYLQTVLDINDGLLVGGGLISSLPTHLQPILGRVIGFPLQRNVAKIKKWLVPLWKQRIDIVRQGDENADEPQDHVQMMARYALKERPEEVEDHELIVRRISAQNFGAVHQTALQVCNLLLDILGSDAEYDTIAHLREETDLILGSTAGTRGAPEEWTKAKVQKMVHADSASRETLRLHAFANRAVMRKVMSHGVTTPEGHDLPKGTLVSFLTYPSHTSEDTHNNPLKYDPFRFSRATRGGPPVAFVTTGPDLLAFGHGRHACPGRFLVDFELKMVVAYVLRHYDIKFPESYKGIRPPNVWITEATFPPPGVKLCVRRKA